MEGGVYVVMAAMEERSNIIVVLISSPSLRDLITNYHITTVTPPPPLQHTPVFSSLIGPPQTMLCSHWWDLDHSVAQSALFCHKEPAGAP